MFLIFSKVNPWLFANVLEDDQSRVLMLSQDLWDLPDAILKSKYLHRFSKSASFSWISSSTSMIAFILCMIDPAIIVAWIGYEITFACFFVIIILCFLLTMALLTGIPVIHAKAAFLHNFTFWYVSLLAALYISLASISWIDDYMTYTTESRNMYILWQVYSSSCFILISVAVLVCEILFNIRRNVRVLIQFMFIANAIRVILSDAFNNGNYYPKSHEPKCILAFCTTVRKLILGSLITLLLFSMKQLSIFILKPNSFSVMSMTMDYFEFNLQDENNATDKFPDTIISSMVPHPAFVDMIQRRNSGLSSLAATMKRRKTRKTIRHQQPLIEDTSSTPEASISKSNTLFQLERFEVAPPTIKDREADEADDDDANNIDTNEEIENSCLPSQVAEVDQAEDSIVDSRMFIRTKQQYDPSSDETEERSLSKSMSRSQSQYNKRRIVSTLSKHNSSNVSTHSRASHENSNPIGEVSSSPFLDPAQSSLGRLLSTFMQSYLYAYQLFVFSVMQFMALSCIWYQHATAWNIGFMTVAALVPLLVFESTRFSRVLFAALWHEFEFVFLVANALLVSVFGCWSSLAAISMNASSSDVCNIVLYHIYACVMMIYILSLDARLMLSIRSRMCMLFAGAIFYLYNMLHMQLGLNIWSRVDLFFIIFTDTASIAQSCSGTLLLFSLRAMVHEFMCYKRGQKLIEELSSNGNRVSAIVPDGEDDSVNGDEFTLPFPRSFLFLRCGLEFENDV